MLEDSGGEPLERLVGAPMEAGRFLSLAIGIVAALGKAYQRGLVHKDVKPANILVNCTEGRTRLTRFGIASRLPRERQPPEPPEVIAGMLAYMAPEQTGRMNCSIDFRSDLYALGVTFYQMPPAICRSAPPNRWNGSTAISPERLWRRRNGWRVFRPFFRDRHEVAGIAIESVQEDGGLVPSARRTNFELRVGYLSCAGRTRVRGLLRRS